MAHPDNEQFFARLAALNEKFARVLPATLDRLTGLAAELDKEAPARVAAELQAVLHTIAGSAATFGLRGLGQQARALERRLRVLMTFDAVAAADWDGWLAELAGFIGAARCDPRALG